MRTFQQIFSFTKAARTLAAGILLAGLLSGCTTPFVNVVVQVDSCQAGGPGKPPNIPMPGVGLCVFANPTTGPIPPPPATICKDHNLSIIPCPANATCTSGPGRCDANTPGSNRSGKICKTIWVQSATHPTEGACDCNTNY
jgi:hypothetical protein